MPSADERTILDLAEDLDRLNELSKRAFAFATCCICSAEMSQRCADLASFPQLHGESMSFREQCECIVEITSVESPGADVPEGEYDLDKIVRLSSQSQLLFHATQRGAIFESRMVNDADASDRAGDSTDVGRLPTDLQHLSIAAQ